MSYDTLPFLIYALGDIRLRHDSTVLLALCRRYLLVSPQPQAKVQQIFLHLPKPPYLCVQLINSINIKNLKIMVQQNEMSARALTMEEMENVNGGKRHISFYPPKVS